MPALPFAKTAGNPLAPDRAVRPAGQKGAQSLRRELRGQGGLQMPHFIADSRFHRKWMVKKPPRLASSPAVERWVGS